MILRLLRLFRPGRPRPRPVVDITPTGWHVVRRDGSRVPVYAARRTVA